MTSDSRRLELLTLNQEPSSKQALAPNTLSRSMRAVPIALDSVQIYHGLPYKSFEFGMQEAAISASSICRSLPAVDQRIRMR